MGPAARGHDAEALGAGRMGLACAVEDFFDRQHAVAWNRRLRDARLGAVVAVFWTDAALGVEQHVDLDAVAEKVPTHTPGRLDESQRLFVGKLQKRAGYVACGRPVFERIDHQLIPGDFHGAVYGLVRGW